MLCFRPLHWRSDVEASVQDAAERGANIVVLPEMWNCPYSNDSFPTYAEDISGGASKSFKAISATAKAMEVMVIAGSIPERQDDKLYNTCCVFDTDGSLLGSYRCFTSAMPCRHQSV